ncbi:PHP domain-containing protein [Candidatus Protochlamydia phocaeensis]|uniref:PHP domain-containing protein n=1 Tax=Candidatus Protochlamydia phocaeensis TaxID=1414722 RepID=UPI0008393090|nr:PHP domain-containing protein [Candidatus Protochlamydia phocaeensis]
MNDFRADLHCHSTCSDGTYTPQKLIELAIEKQLQGLSITDHDTIAAYKEAMPLAQERHFPLISGVEFSAVHRQTSIHILAYSFPLHSGQIDEFCARHAQRRSKRNQAIINRLSLRGMPLSEEDLQALPYPASSIGRPHIALAMLKKGYVSSIQQAFQDHIGEGKPCYEGGESFSIEETLAVIHQAKGLAVIAHPHLIGNVKVLRDLLDMNFDGIEGYYGRFPLSEHKRWIKIGARKGWLITGGSDFHGEIKPALPLGSSWVNEETFSILHNHFKNNQIHSSL